MRLFLIGIIISFNIFAVNWTELEEGKAYKLSQSFQLPQIERSGSLFDIVKGDQVTLKEIMPLELSFPVMAYIFKYHNCPGTGMKTDMELVTVQNTGVEVGAVLEKCELSVYVETRDIDSKSLFE